MPKVYLAVDLGASSGRVVAGLFDGGRVQLEEVHRFPNGGVPVGERLHWDLLGLWTSVQDGLRAAAQRYGDQVASVGVDTWGVDFGLLGRGDVLLGNPSHYRDRRTAGILPKAFSLVPREEIFAQTGLQFMEFNTLYQLLAMKLEDSPLLDVAETFLMIPDLFHWLLTGEKVNEFTNASTTQFHDPQAKTWARPLLTKLGLPTHVLGQLVEPGTNLGKLQKSAAEATGLTGAEVVLPGTHDTASAVMAVPAESGEPKAESGSGFPLSSFGFPSALRSPPDWCYISSGTWSLMGVESPAPVVTEKCRQLNFTNEGGVGGTTRLLKNIAGLWLVQECRRIWALSGKDFTWEQLVQAAAETRPLASLIDPDHPSFTAPQNMPAAIREFCRQTGQPLPETEGAVIRCALESLALRYRLVLGWLEELTGGRIETIHIVGGGVNNRLLCQMAADACNRRVLAGPTEATALGNVLVQAIASGQLDSIAQAREVVRRSFAVEEYTPQSPEPWDEAFARFQTLV